MHHEPQIGDIVRFVAYNQNAVILDRCIIGNVRRVTKEYRLRHDTLGVIMTHMYKNEAMAHNIMSDYWHVLIDGVYTYLYRDELELVTVEDVCYDT